MSWARSMPSEFGTQSAWPDGTAISVKAPRSSMMTDSVTALKDLWPQTPDVVCMLYQCLVLLIGCK